MVPGTNLTASSPCNPSPLRIKMGIILIKLTSQRIGKFAVRNLI